MLSYDFLSEGDIDVEVSRNEEAIPESANEQHVIRCLLANDESF